MADPKNPSQPKHKGITRREFTLGLGATLGLSACGKQACVKGPIAKPVAGPSIEPPPLNQLAFSVLDVAAMRRWYQDKLGFLPSGGTDDFGNPIGSWIQGLPNVDVATRWMVDQQEFLQLEMFQFKNPKSKSRPQDWAPNDSGYTIIGVHVSDFDARVAALRTAGVALLTEPIGAPGFRRVCVRDSEGNIVELMEEDPRQGGTKSRARLRPEVPVVARSITVSVPDIERSRRFFVDTLRLEECTDFVLHRPEHEELWNLKGAAAKTHLLWAGDFLVELRQYTNPAAKSWPRGYRICDQGMMNIAFGFRKRKDFDQICDRAYESGYRSNSPPFHLFDWGTVYMNDDQCLSVELLWVEPGANRKMGFEPENEGA